jgi:catechol 2,3-dioxygenase-like lactoylglutathione lyase family enzyme
MAITGAHAILYTSEPDAVRAIFRDVLGYRNVDAGGGWLIFELPPAEVAMHPTDGAASQELSFMCDDLEATVAELRDKGIDVDTDLHEERWGVTTRMHLPGGLDLLLYEPRHPTLR